MVEENIYRQVGWALELLSSCQFHKSQPVGEYFEIRVLQPIWRRQIKFYFSSSGKPEAMATWAWLNDDTLVSVLETGRALERVEWTNGDNLFFNDWITPSGDTREIEYDMTHHVFPNEEATSLQRNADDSVQRVKRWEGQNVGTQAQRVTHE